MDNYYSVDVPELEGYIRFSEKLEGSILQDSEVVAEYYLENNNLAFTGLDSSGNETTDEVNIVAYEVSGIGECNVSKIAIPREHNAKPVTKIKINAFSSKSTLQSVIIEDNIKSIEMHAFANCKNLEQVSINASSISSEVFKLDTKLKKVIIGKNVSVIKEYIFNGCSNIDDLTILTEKANISNINIAAGNLLKEVKINDDNSKYTVEDGVLFSKDGTKIYAYPTGKTGDTYIIPKNVTTIGGCAFASNSYLKYIDVPDTVTSIGSAAFSGHSIKELNLNINWLSDEAIRGCSNLEKITIGKNLKRMGGAAFNGTNKLQSITYLGTVEEWNKIMEKNTSWRGGNTSIKKIICSDGEIIL